MVLVGLCHTFAALQMISLNRSITFKLVQGTRKHIRYNLGLKGPKRKPLMSNMEILQLQIRTTPLRDHTEASTTVQALLQC